ncbi:unnamed protein product [Ilex paraguariensis]|uniref:Uncharacterized protein n=1 Tax=Ilex paraguariensis TaxID=185542 RepID=A0ABC8T012_9AQUA
MIPKVEKKLLKELMVARALETRTYKDQRANYEFYRAPYQSFEPNVPLQPLRVLKLLNLRDWTLPVLTMRSLEKLLQELKDHQKAKVSLNKTLEARNELHHLKNEMQGKLAASEATILEPSARAEKVEEEKEALSLKVSEL